MDCSGGPHLNELDENKLIHQMTQNDVVGYFATSFTVTPFIGFTLFLSHPVPALRP